MLFRFLFALGEFVAELAEIHEAADGRNGVGRNLLQIHAVLAREVQCLGEQDDAHLIAVGADDANFAGADFAVDPVEGGGVVVARGERATQANLSGWG